MFSLRDLGNQAFVELGGPDAKLIVVNSHKPLSEGTIPLNRLSLVRSLGWPSPNMEVQGGHRGGLKRAGNLESKALKVKVL